MAVRSKRPTTAKDECVVEPTRDCPAEGYASQIAELGKHLELSALALQTSVTRIEDFVNKAEKALFGNGTPGLMTRMDRIEQSDLRREKTQEGIRKVAISVVVGLIIQGLCVMAAGIYAMVKLYQSHAPGL
jgi:hypothetical protein